MGFIRRIMNPTLFQGVGRRSNYFEGWYHKHVSSTGFAYAIIGGIALSKTSQGHSFVQVICGEDGSTSYVSYPLDQFTFDDSKYSIGIGPNLFSHSRLFLEIETPRLNLSGELCYHDPVLLRRSPLRPGIMGWYRFVPSMECYHGIVSLHHTIEGELCIDGEDVDFSGGVGYIEKDWGSSMPSQWIWLQANSFASPKTSLMVSIATIPWMRSSFVGFLGLFHQGDKQYRFTTYTGAVIHRLEVSDSQVCIEIHDGEYLYKIEAEREGTGFLKAPVLGDMDRRIAESIDATVDMKLERRDSKEVLFQGRSRHAGLELVGDISRLTHNVIKG